MASEEAKFAARADRLAGRQGVAGFMPAAAPTNRYIMPQFVEKTPYGMKTQDAYSRLFEDRIIFLGVQVDDASADDVMAQLLVLESQDPNRDVMMYINSPGGSMTAMTASTTPCSTSSPMCRPYASVRPPPQRRFCWLPAPRASV